MQSYLNSKPACLLNQSGHCWKAAHRFLVGRNPNCSGWCKTDQMSLKRIIKFWTELAGIESSGTTFSTKGHRPNTIFISQTGTVTHTCSFLWRSIASHVGTLMLWHVVYFGFDTVLLKTYTLRIMCFLEFLAFGRYRNDNVCKFLPLFPTLFWTHKRRRR